MTTTTRKHLKLTDLFQKVEQETLQSTWDTTNTAPENAPIPRGRYDARITSGELFNSRQGTKGYRLTFEVSGGEYTGRRFWLDLWLTPHAMPYTKRDLRKLGVNQIKDLDRPLPECTKVRADVVVHKADDGLERNRVTLFEVLTDTPAVGDAYEPPDLKTIPDFDPAELDALIAPAQARKED